MSIIFVNKNKYNIDKSKINDNIYLKEFETDFK